MSGMVTRPGQVSRLTAPTSPVPRRQQSLFDDETPRKKMHHVGTTFEVMALNLLADKREGQDISEFRIGVAKAVLTHAVNRRALAEAEAEARA